MRASAVVIVAALASGGAAQPPDHGGMHMGGAVLFLGRADADQVVPRQASAATATAAIIVDLRRAQLRYDLTFNGLERGGASRIALFNFGAGGNGTTVAILCGGGDAPACPAGGGARLAGTSDIRRWSGPLLSEFASGRIYVQVDGGDGRPEIRGQLAANMGMVPSRAYVARLTPGSQPGATGEGTAVLSETFLPGGRVAVQYHVTVAGTAGRPEAAALIGAPPQTETAVRFLDAQRLPNARRQLARRSQAGATFSGGYTARGAAPSQPLANAMLAGARRPVLAIRTSRFPRGELFGEFVPVE